MAKTKKQLDRDIAAVLARPKSSVRLVRNRQAALRDFNSLVQKPLRGGEPMFLQGFEYVRRDIIKGLSPDEALDISTSVQGVPRAFHDGARAASIFYEVQRNGGNAVYAHKLAAAYGTKLPE